MSAPLTTDPQEELLTEVNSNNEVIGSISREVAHNSPDKIYRTIFVVVKDKTNKILLQKRSSTKDLYPDCWDLSVGGHVNYGKSYLETAVKELEEELGIVTPAKELKFVGEVLVKLPTSNEFFHVFEYKLKPKDNIKLETNEVSKTIWMSIGQVKKTMQQQKLKWYARPLQVIKALY
ncbi:MAG: NUDIX domain-containing protein [Patescibacteria group bacterium]|nr:NUDIX domain-containing protein [Patescibacteria group bacterium]